MATNLNSYTEFQAIPIGQKFIDADGHEYTKVSASTARHLDLRYKDGYMDYEFSAEDRLRVQN